MRPVSSVAAFLALYLADTGERDPTAGELLGQLGAEERAVLAAQRVAPQLRGAFLRERTGHDWGDEAIAHVEARALITLRRLLQARGLLR